MSRMLYDEQSPTFWLVLVFSGVRFHFTGPGVIGLAELAFTSDMMGFGAAILVIPRVRETLCSWQVAHSLFSESDEKGKKTKRPSTDKSIEVEIG